LRLVRKGACAALRIDDRASWAPRRSGRGALYEVEDRRSRF